MKLLDIEDYKMGRDKTFVDQWSDELEDNANALLDAVNAALLDLGIKKATVSSGWRPPSLNAAVAKAAKKSKHMTCHAVDLYDDKRQLLASLCLLNLDILEKHGLYLEDPTSTRGKFSNWVHLQNKAPNSGKRVFKP